MSVNNSEFIKLYNIAKVSLDDPTRQAKLRKVILDYFDLNAEVLHVPSMAKKPVFLKNRDQDIIFESLGSDDTNVIISPTCNSLASLFFVITTSLGIISGIIEPVNTT